MPLSARWSSAGGGRAWSIRTLEEECFAIRVRNLPALSAAGEKSVANRTVFSAPFASLPVIAIGFLLTGQRFSADSDIFGEKVYTAL
jgi:hypothetical protein